MTLLATERIKFLSTRSPWWCMLLAIGVTIGFAGLFAAAADSAEFVDVRTSQVGYRFSLPIIMVLAALAVTTEYRFNTIRTTFLAVPNRASVLVAKSVVVAIAAGLIGLVAAFGSWGVAKLIKPEANLAINEAAEWRNVAGVSVIFAFTAIIAVAVGFIIRHTAGAVAVLLTYALVLEDLVQMIPNIGNDIHRWLPFTVAQRFLTGGMGSERPDGPSPAASTLDPWWALAYFAGFSVVLLIVAIVTAKKRDA